MGYTKGESLVLGFSTEQAVRNLLKSKGRLSRRDLHNYLRSRKDLFDTLDRMAKDGEIKAGRERQEGRPGNPPLIYSLPDAPPEARRSRK